MLRAILHGKAGRVFIGGMDQSWRELFRQREDLLTSVFFGRFAYLSEGALKDTLALLVSKASTDALGSFEDITFWPKFQVDQSGRFVEPDVLIELEHATVLVEVKPPAGGLQNHSQWKAEIEGFVRRNEYADGTLEKSALHFVALGRNVAGWTSWKDALEKEFAEAKLKVHAVDWKELCAGVMDLLRGDCSSSDKAVFSDWLDAFSLYGLHMRAPPFEELMTVGPGKLDGWESMFDEYALPVEVLDWQPLSDAVAALELRIEKWS